MNRDFIKDFFQIYNKILPELEMYLNQDKVDKVKKMMRQMELEYALFKQKYMREVAKL